MKKTNVVILFTDDQRFDTINALGNKEIHTPNMDKMVAEGTTFTQAHIPGGTCGAVCMPSRAMLHTGRHLFELDKQGQKIPDDHILMGETFRKEGYECFGTGKWHNGSASYARSFTCGDNIFFGGMHDHWQVPVHEFDEKGNYGGRMKKITNFLQNNVTDQYTATKVHNGVHSTDFLAESLLNFLDKDHEKPFFAYTAFLAPHDPRTMPEKFREMYKEEDISLPPNFQNYHHIEYDNWNCRDETLAPYPRTIQDTKKQIAEYYAMISHLDYQIGRVLDKLEEKGLKDNTIVVLAGDNGLAVGQHGLFGKQSLYDHSLRVPLIFTGEQIPRGKQSESLVFLSDIYPTLCELLGIERPKSITCPSFAPVLEEKQETVREHLYFAYTDKIRGVRKDDFKYIEHRYNEIVTKSLFDLKNDPYEMANLLHHPDYEEKGKDMQKVMYEESLISGERNQKLGENYWGGS